MSVATAVKVVSAKEVPAGAKIVDVRTGVEYQSVHATGAKHMPLQELKPAKLLEGSPDRGTIYLICKSGKRAQSAAQRCIAEGVTDVCVIDGGTDAWLAAGLPVVRGKAVMPLERQVRIAAGLLVLTGVILGWTVHVGFFGLSGFVGAGLVFAGITDWCGMGMLLARMPWNRGSGCTSCSGS